MVLLQYRGVRRLLAEKQFRPRSQNKPICFMVIAPASKTPPSCSQIRGRVMRHFIPLFCICYH